MANSPEIIDCEQGSEAWLQARSGIVTASEFTNVMMTPGPRGGLPAGREKYMRRLVGELITGKPEDTYRSKDMERGQEMEAEAREHYAYLKDAKPVRIGFVKNFGAGASPDSLMGDDGLLEIKTNKPSVLIEIHESCTVPGNSIIPSEHIDQVQGQLWITQRKWCDYFCYWPGMKPYLVRVPRDERRIAELKVGVTRFLAELKVRYERHK